MSNLTDEDKRQKRATRNQIAIITSRIRQTKFIIITLIISRIYDLISQKAIFYSQTNTYLMVYLLA